MNPTSKKTDVPKVPPPSGAIPYLIVRGADDALGYYQRVFGAELVVRLDDPEGKVLHSELKVGQQRFMLTEERPEMGSRSPQALGGTASMAVIYVDDTDAVVQRAVDAGAKVLMPVADQFWGDRSGNIVDPFGHAWFISTHLEEPSHEEIQRRLQAMFADGPQGGSGSAA